MKLIYKNHHIKNIPKKFECIKDIQDYMDDLDSKRLSASERHNLDLQLMITMLSSFLSKLNGNTALRDLLKGSEPVIGVEVTTKSGRYYGVRFSNKMEVRCEADIYKCRSIKEKIKRLY